MGPAYVYVLYTSYIFSNSDNIWVDLKKDKKIIHLTVPGDNDDGNCFFHIPALIYLEILALIYLEISVGVCKIYMLLPK